MPQLILQLVKLVNFLAGRLASALSAGSLAWSKLSSVLRTIMPKLQQVPGFDRAAWSSVEKAVATKSLPALKQSLPLAIAPKGSSASDIFKSITIFATGFGFSDIIEMGSEIMNSESNDDVIEVEAVEHVPSEQPKHIAVVDPKLDNLLDSLSKFDELAEDLQILAGILGVTRPRAALLVQQLNRMLPNADAYASIAGRV